jgi:hypothetical protein
MYAPQMDWFMALLVGFAGFAGTLGASARTGDRLSDIPRVFMRHPWKLIAVWIGFSALFVAVRH